MKSYVFLLLCILLLLCMVLISTRGEEYIRSIPNYQTTSLQVEEDVETTPSIPEIVVSREDVEYIAKTLYGECRGVPSDMEKAAVAWVILNRIDAGYGESVMEVVSEPYQFLGYDTANPLREDLLAIAEDVLVRWSLEKIGNTTGRIIPPDYLWFIGKDGRNYFRNEYKSSEYWDWSLENPYED